jgi:hypothetical protein
VREIEKYREVWIKCKICNGDGIIRCTSGGNDVPCNCRFLGNHPGFLPILEPINGKKENG